MPILDEIMHNTDYLFFKAWIRPEWEDPYNTQGGKWVLTINTEEIPKVNLQDIWEKIVK